MPSLWCGASHTLSSGIIGLSLLAVAPAAAQDYPERAVTIIVGFSTGGGVDLMARLVAENLSERLGSPFVVDNRPGASGTIAGNAVANAEPDGYTLLMVPIAHAANAGIQADLPYDTLEDFAPVSLVASAPNVILVHPSAPGDTLADFLSAVEASPGEYDFASSGIGSSTHLAAELLKLEGDVDLTHIPYQGGGEALTGVLSGEVDLYIASIPAGMSHLQSGGLKGLAVTGTSRSSALPDLPTAMEAGLAGYEYSGWYGLLAPAGTPDAVIDELSTEIAAILELPEVLEFVEASGAEPVGSTPEEFGAYLDSEVAKWGRVVEAAGLKQ